MSGGGGGDHGIMRPNPALLHDLEEQRQLKSRPVIAHNLGAGAECTVCGPKCPGFQLHFWRKHCSNCRCGKVDHNVHLLEATSGDTEDGGFFFVGKIFDRPLRSKQEVMEFEFCNPAAAAAADESSCESNNNSQHLPSSAKTKRVRFDWIPDNVSQTLARRYMKQLPESQLPIAGSQGAKDRQHRLEKQFPVHDIEPDQCAGTLPPEELEGMLDYIGHVKKDVAGQATVHELPSDEQARLLPDEQDHDLPPPPPELLMQDDEQIYANLPLKSGTRAPTSSGSGSVNLYHARPYHSLLSPGLPPPLAPSPPPPPPPLPQSSCSGKFCQRCSQELYNGDVAIRADRAGTGKVWHPQCFKCFTCNELLVDLLYYHKGGNVYCARDYAVLMKIPRCAACDELIFASEFTGAEDKVWHLRHFCCFECDKPLAGHKYVPDAGGQPHCLMCFQRKHGKLCNTCGAYISPEDKRLSLPMKKAMMTSAMTSSTNDVLVHWHANPECFSCKVCHKSLINQKMTIKFGAILCSSKCLTELQMTL